MYSQYVSYIDFSSFSHKFFFEELVDMSTYNLSKKFITFGFNNQGNEVHVCLLPCLMTMFKHFKQSNLYYTYLKV
jgi:hypothetical protein